MLVIEWYAYWELLPRLRAEESLEAYSSVYAAQVGAPKEERRNLINGWLMRLGDEIKKLIDTDENGVTAGARAQVRRVFQWMSLYGYKVEGE